MTFGTSSFMSGNDVIDLEEQKLTGVAAALGARPPDVSKREGGYWVELVDSAAIGKG
jgi:hypothetical protein